MTFKTKNFNDFDIKSFAKNVIDKGIFAKGSPEVDAQKQIAEDSYSKAGNHLYTINDLVNKSFGAYVNMPFGEDGSWKAYWEKIRNITGFLNMEDLTLEKISELAELTRYITYFVRKTNRKQLALEVDPHVSSVLLLLSAAYKAKQEMLRLYKQEVINDAKAGQPKEASLVPTSNVSQNILSLIVGLNKLGYADFANELQGNFLEYKKAVAAKDGGEALIEEAHPEGSPTLENMVGDAKIETILDTHLQMLNLLKKQPTAKLASSKDILNAVSFLKKKVAQEIEAPNFPEEEKTYNAVLTDFDKYIEFLTTTFNLSERDLEGTMKPSALNDTKSRVLDALKFITPNKIKTFEAVLIGQKDQVRALKKMGFGVQSLSKTIQIMNSIIETIKRIKETDESRITGKVKTAAVIKINSFISRLNDIIKQIQEKNTKSQTDTISPQTNTIKTDPNSPAVSKNEKGPELSDPSKAARVKEFDQKIRYYKDKAKEWMSFVELDKRNLDPRTNALNPKAQGALDWITKRHDEIDALFARFNDKTKITNREMSIESFFRLLNQYVADFPRFKNVWIGEE